MMKIHHPIGTGWTWHHMYGEFRGLVSKKVSRKLAQTVAHELHFWYINEGPNVQEACHHKLTEERHRKLYALERSVRTRLGGWS
jgi:hypothetical protein